MHISPEPKPILPSFEPPLPKESSQESPDELSSLRDTLIKHAILLKGGDLTSDEINEVEKHLQTLEKIAHASKGVFAKVSNSDLKAPWKVRAESSITIGNITHSLFLGRNYKALLVYGKAQEVIGFGGYGSVKPVAVDLKTDAEIIQKTAFRTESKIPEDLQREVQIPKILHEKAGGYQTGIQYAPYALQNFGSKSIPQYGFLARRYISTLEPAKILSAENRAKIGLENPRMVIATLKPLFQALACIHQNGFAHRDIKPSNIGIQKSSTGSIEACFADFGGAVTKDDKGKSWGTSHYLGIQDELMQAYTTDPDELLELRQFQDVFALGRTITETLYSLVTNCESTALSYALDKYTTKNPQEYTNASDDPIVEIALSDIGERFGEEVSKLLKEMLESVPTMRPAAETALARWNSISV